MDGVITGSGQWSYVAAAYAMTALVSALVLWRSWRAMRTAEARSDALRKEQRGGRLVI
ncbi:hypothetical protein [Sphingopyxis yananensis]|uniref:hypothetical protein n=1 Tax=Sphingopyxis yananensis TaxID=2886687 RepID=UPI001D10BAA7|nr:hypothetical protein [Sphingopyxis yananensis]MCC2603390.1 hypothetical protein [Sphingopyxis yananensis]